MNFGDFKTMVAAYMQRDTTAFVIGTSDLLALAINMSRRETERRRDFEMSKVQARLSVNIASGASLANAVLASDGITAVVVKTVHKAFLPISDGSGYFPVQVISRAKHNQQLERYYDQVQKLEDAATQVGMPVDYFALVRMANDVYLIPSDTTAYSGSTSITVLLDIVKWLPDYTANGDTDFLLEYCTSYMLLQTVYILNPMLKEDVRVPITERQLDRAWHSVIAWDSNLVLNSAEDAALD